MWTKFRNMYYPTITIDEYDYVYIESNEPCARMFIDSIFDRQIHKYTLSFHSDCKEPTLTNVSEYVGNYNSIDDCYYRVRVITLRELQSLNLVSKDIYHRNLLIKYDTVSDYLDANSVLTNPASR